MTVLTEADRPVRGRRLSWQQFFAIRPDLRRRTITRWIKLAKRQMNNSERGAVDIVAPHHLKALIRGHQEISGFRFIDLP